MEYCAGCGRKIEKGPIRRGLLAFHVTCAPVEIAPRSVPKQINKPRSLLDFSDSHLVQELEASLSLTNYPPCVRVTK